MSLLTRLTADHYDAVEPALADVFDADTRHDCVTIELDDAQATWGIQFATGTTWEPAVWNVHSDPPDRCPEGFPVVDIGDRHLLFGSWATTPEVARTELDDVCAAFGVEDPEITAVYAFDMMKSPGYHVKQAKEKFGEAVQQFREVLG